MTAETHKHIRQQAYKVMDNAYYDMYIQCGYPITTKTLETWNERLIRTALAKVSTYLTALDELITIERKTINAMIADKVNGIEYPYGLKAHEADLEYHTNQREEAYQLQQTIKGYLRKF